MKILLTIKNLLLAALVVSCVTSCKKSVAPPNPLGDGDIHIWASAAEQTGKQSTQGSKAANTIPDNFGAGSSIGLYSQLKSEADAASENFLNKTNSRFDYAIPLWSPKALSDKMMYPESDLPIYILGYSPHTGVKNSSVTAVPGSTTEFYYSLSTDQSQQERLSISDLMWCKATKGGEGYTRSGEPILLEFGHRLCKVGLRIRFVDSRPNATSNTSAVLKNVTITGPEIYTQGRFSISTGILTPEVPTQNGQVYWVSGEELRIPVTERSATPTTVTEFILIPFVATDLVNSIVYTIKFDGDTAYPDGRSFRSDIPKYTGTTQEPATANGNGLRFGMNDYNLITATIDISTAYISLEATIVPWGTGHETDLETERN